MIRLEHYFAVGALLLLVVSVISLYNFITKRQLLSGHILTLLEILTILSVTFFIFKFSIYKHICILTNLGLNLLNFSFIGLILSFLFSALFRIKPLFAILSPIFFVTYVVGFVKSLNVIPHQTSPYTILTYIHITLFTTGIIFNLLSLICFFLEKYFYLALKRKVWSNIIFMTESIEKIGIIGLVCLIMTMLVFGLGSFVGVYKVIDKGEFQFFVDPLPVGTIVSFLLLVTTSLCRMLDIKWLSYFNVTLISNTIIIGAYMVHLLFGIGRHN